MEKHEKLKQRAHILSQEILTQEDENTLLDVVTFILGKETYALESHYIEQVCPLNEVTRLPNVPNFVYGIINVRRKVFSVVDLKKLFDIEDDKSRSSNPTAIILNDNSMQFAIYVDLLLGVSKINPATLITNLPTIFGIRSQLLKGITPERIAILDGGKLLTNQAMRVES